MAFDSRHRLNYVFASKLRFWWLVTSGAQLSISTDTRSQMPENVMTSEDNELVLSEKFWHGTQSGLNLSLSLIVMWINQVALVYKAQSSHWEIDTMKLNFII